MIRLSRILMLCGILIFVPGVTLSRPQSNEPKKLSGPEITDALQEARIFRPDIFPQFVVEKTTPFTQQALPVKELIFKPGSNLFLTGPWGDKSNRYIIAETIRILAGGEIPSITWERDAAVPDAPEIGPAPNGYPSGGDGSPGTSGTDGQVGNPGFPGRNAPTLYIFVHNIVVESDNKPALKIDFRGHDGGKGGQGQKGGDGGNGRAGRPGVSSAFDCRSGGQQGGQGGNGGNGGKGGPGGRGGNGGVVIIASLSSTIEDAPHLLSVEMTGGQGGKGGTRGDFGQGGLGGLGGNGSAYCSGGVQGPQGKHGDFGSDGDFGKSGAPGVFGVVELSNDKLSSLGLQ
jgi:hypothetical protein